MEFERPKFGTKTWFENYWYHYKWHTIAGVIIALLLITFVKDMVTRERYDSAVLLASRTYIRAEQKEKIKEVLERYELDHDGNGEVNINLIMVQFPEDDSGANAQMQMAEQVRFMAELSSGNAFTLILDPYSAKMIMQDDSSVSPFIDLSLYSGGEDGKDGLLPLKYSPLGNEPDLEPLLGELSLAFRSSDFLPSQKEEDMENYKLSGEFLTRFLEDKPVA